ncbi:MAG TPA: adenylate/guanylate cyclase domain-containing protein [Actinomycetota bacterium]
MSLDFSPVTCPSCGRENPEGFQFCGYCGASLSAGPAPALEERKVVTVLFCDLVGFTARSDRADPEDVKATLRPFHARLKREIEAFGGTLDKFIGDAALGVFGSPIAHEDDPERAVRAALAIQEAMAALNAADPVLRLTVRQGINTGEAVVAPGTGPQIGEAVTGDVVNTASRLQSVAPPGAIVVGEATYRATKDAVVYEPLEAVTVKGKAEPLRLWRVVAARVRFASGLTRTHAVPLVGREAEVKALGDAFARARRNASAQLATVVGEPGVGKSRLVAELAKHVEALPDPVPWRLGRCLPYGEGITFWALGEIVKGHAGILESDSPDEAAAKLDAAIPGTEPDRQWLKQRLAPLVGVEATSPAEREELFTAWRRFLESIASAGPAVFVFEDVHWADPAMLAFIEYLVEEAAGFAMLLVCTARPELSERHPDWASARNATRIDLHPLTAGETARLVSSLLDRATLPEDVQALLLERAGGNPLYAEEFVRMLEDQALLVREDSAWRLAAGAHVRVPESIHSLIAARLDTLAPASKAMLQDAAVIGKVFWAGAVAAIGGRDEAAVRVALDELSRKELVRRELVSSIDGQAEFAFWHALVRDVCYGQIPRASRGAKHRAAAAWTERIAGERVDDLAEVLAHHYTTALDLTRAAGLVDEAGELEDPARRFLVRAGDRAIGLDVSTAMERYAKALELAPPGHHDRSEILARWADAARQSGRAPEAATALEEAIEAFRVRGDHLAAARTMATLASVLQNTGSARQAEVAVAAVELLEFEPPGPDLLAAYARMAGVTLVQGDPRATLVWADRAVALAADLGIDVPSRVLGFRGYARCSLGDAAGLEDMRAALALAVDRGEGRDAAVLYNNLAVAMWSIEGPAGVLALLEEGIDFSARRGIEEFAIAMSAASCDQLIDAGEWDSALKTARAISGRAEASGDVADLLQARWAQTRVLASRGEGDTAAALAEWLVEAARESGGVEDVIAGFCAAAMAYRAAGRPDLALELVSEVAARSHVRQSPTYPGFLCELLRTALAAGDPSLAARLVEGVEPVFPHHEHALCAAGAILAEADGRHEEAAERYAEAAERWDGFGVVPERAHALLGEGRCLLALGRSDRAAAPLREAREIFARLRAGPALAEVDSLLRNGFRPS